MPNFHKSPRQDMQEESAQKLRSGKSHQFRLVVMVAIFPFKRNMTVANAFNAMVRYGDPVSIAPEVFNDRVCVFKGLFAKNDPFQVIQLVQ